MKCSVNNCTNDTQTLRKGHGITFHTFPWFRNNWREVLGMEDEPNPNSLVCSDHFKSEDIYVTKAGQPKTRVGALPIRCRRVQVCRICLATDVKMYRIRDQDLKQAYADVCGIIIEEDNLKDKLPENLCWECAPRLLAGSRLRDRAIRSHQLLTQFLETNPYITLRDIKTINRSENGLESNLSPHYNEPNDCDMYIEEGILNKADTDDIIMEIEEIDSFEEDNFEEANVVEEKNDSDNDLTNDDFEEEYLEESKVVEERNQTDSDLNNEWELDYSGGEENIDEDEDDGNDERRVLKAEVNISDDDEHDDGERNKFNHRYVDENEGENEDDGNDERRVLKEEANISDDDEYDDGGRNELNHREGDENEDDGNDERRVLKAEANSLDDDEYDDGGRNELNYRDGEENEDQNEDYGNDELLKVAANISDHDEYDDDGRCDLNDSDENIEDKVSTVKKRKSILKVKTPKRKLAKKDEEKNSKAKDKPAATQVKRSKPHCLDRSMFTITSLSLEEQLQDAQRRRDAPRNMKARYRCDVCGIGFAKINRYELHLVKHSELAGQYQCAVCATRQKTEAAMLKHLASIHSRRYSCKKCPFVTQTRSNANSHQEWHVGARFQCPRCPCLFTQIYCSKCKHITSGNRSSYLCHLRYKHRADFICELCGYAFLSKRGVAIHRNMLHRFIDEKMPREGPHCETCDVTFMSAEAHDRHLKVASQHSDQSASNLIRNDPQSVSDKAAQKRVRRRLRIPSCGATDKDGTSDNEELVTCEQCGKEFLGYRLYAQHFRYKHPEKIRTQFSGKNDTVMCEQCGRLFQSNTVLRDHMATHTGQKLYQCNFCNRKFEQKSDLTEHIKKTNHVGDITFECDKCEKTFSKKSTFVAHSKTHLRHDCSICGKEFIHPSNRRRHMWTHTALKPFKCGACDRTFANPSGQKSHYKHEHLKKPWPKRKKDLPPEKRRMRVEKRAPPVED